MKKDFALLLSRKKLTAFLACQRRFQLRYQQQLPWPVAPLTDKWQEASERGHEFHRLLQRHFLELPVADPGAEDPILHEWWQTFRQQGPQLPEGERKPEISLTVPLGNHLLTGRFDLLILGEDAVHIFDWKTVAQPPAETVLRNDWQTIIYLALLAEGSAALGRRYEPDEINLAYWFVQAPATPISFTYSVSEHTHNWQRLLALADRIDSQMATVEAWPLTEDLQECARCVYRIFCGRHEVSPATDTVAEEEDEVLLPDLKPALP